MWISQPSEEDLFVQVASLCARLEALYHRATLEGAEHLPAGPALLVGNHGLYGLETPAFFYLVKGATGRFPFGLADRRVFGWMPMQAVLARVGGVVGTRENALTLLNGGHLVVCYPGGAREVFKAKEDRYRLAWDRARGFARVAIQAQVPVVPFAGLGVDDSFVNFGHPSIARRVLGRYAVPLSVGLGPLPLPVRFRFRLGAPLEPPDSLDEVDDFKVEVQRAVEQLLFEGLLAEDGEEANAEPAPNAVP